MTRKMIIVFFLIAFTKSISFADQSKPPVSLMSIEQVEKLAYGTEVYGHSTLGPNGLTKFTGKYLGIFNKTAPGPGHDWIVIELNGLNFKETGIIAGQSGSPVFVKIKGKEYKIGTVSYGDGATKNPIAYLTPIYEVIASEKSIVIGPNPGERMAWGRKLLEKNGVKGLLLKDSFTSGVAAKAGASINYQKELKAGSALAIQLAWGDFDFTATGTVSHIDGDKIYMFGHPLLQLGPVEYRIVPAKVLGVQSSYKSSYVIATPIKDVPAIGVILQDREAGIYGILGKNPEHSVPVTVRLTTSNNEKKEFHFNTISDSYAGPILMGMGVSSIVSGWSRKAGNMTMFVKGKIKIDNEVIEFNQAFMDSEFNNENFVSGIDSLFTTVRDKAATILSNNYSRTIIKEMELDVKIFDEVRNLSIESVSVEQSSIVAGQPANVKVMLAQPREKPKTINLSILIPEDLGDGTGKIIVGNAQVMSDIDAKNISVVSLKTLMSSLKQLRRPDAVYIYVVYPPSKLSDSDANINLGDPNFKRYSKRLFSNVEEYELGMEDFVVGGERSATFKIDSKKEPEGPLPSRRINAQ